jgi:hypothetical protein
MAFFIQSNKSAMIKIQIYHFVIGRVFLYANTM